MTCTLATCICCCMLLIQILNLKLFKQALAAVVKELKREAAALRAADVDQ